MKSALTRTKRIEALAEMERSGVDLLVIGGGVVGAGTALDAATRGLRVGVVEARDWASGTSSRSSKLIHGGLRYLEQMEFGLVREALRERSLILNTLAPHLARPIRFIYPLRRRFIERLYVGAGVLLYDTIGGRKGLTGHRHLLKRQAMRKFPSLRSDALIGAIEYVDGQVDDSRHTMSLVRTAAAHGALCANSAKVVAILKEEGRAVGARIRDVESGREFEVRARHIVAATGVWSDEIQKMLGLPPILRIRVSKGIHILVPRGRIHGETALISKTDTSVLFILPWGHHWLIGTTDTEWTLGLAHPSANKSDIQYLLTEANRLLVMPLSERDVVGVYSGLRPLLSGEHDATSKLSREHIVVTPIPGLSMIAGGKYTTYRVMAADAVDTAVKLSFKKGVAKSCTESVPVVGADGFQAMWNRRYLVAKQYEMDVRRIERLLLRYGTLIEELFELIEAEPELARPITGAPTYLLAEVYYAASAEGALHLDDVLARRTHISIETTDRGVVAAEVVARCIAEPMGWNGSQVEAETARYRARVAAEIHSNQQPDDPSGDQARQLAVDLRADLYRSAT